MANFNSRELQKFINFLGIPKEENKSSLMVDDENKLLKDVLTATPNEEYLKLLEIEKKNIGNIPTESKISKFLGGRVSTDELANRKASEKMDELEKAREAARLTNENLRKKYGEKDYVTPESKYLAKLEKDLGLKESTSSRSIASETPITPEESEELSNTQGKIPASAPITKKASAVSAENFDRDPLIEIIKAESKKPEKEKTDFISLLERAKEVRNQQQLLAGIGRASETLGGAITGMVKGGVVTKPTGTDFYKDLAKQAEQSIEDVGTQYKYETLQEERDRLARRRDPNSEESMFAKATYKEMFNKPAPESMTAEALEKYAPQLTNIYNQQKAIEARAADARERALDREVLLQSKLEGKKLDTALRLAPKIQNKQFEKLSELRTQSALMKESLKNPNPSRDVAIIYGFVKALDPESAVREGEIDFVQLGRSVPTKINQYFKRSFSGEILPEQARKEMADYITQRERQTYKEWELSAGPYLRQADKGGIDRELVAPGSTEMESPIEEQKTKNQIELPKDRKYNPGSRIKTKKGNYIVDPSGLTATEE